MATGASGKSAFSKNRSRISILDLNCDFPILQEGLNQKRLRGDNYLVGN